MVQATDRPSRTQNILFRAYTSAQPVQSRDPPVAINKAVAPILGRASVEASRRNRFDLCTISLTFCLLQNPGAEIICSRASGTSKLIAVQVLVVQLRNRNPPVRSARGYPVRATRSRAVSSVNPRSHPITTQCSSFRREPLPQSRRYSDATSPHACQQPCYNSNHRLHVNNAISVPI